MCSYERWRDLLRRRLEEHADDAATSQVRKVLLDENAELEDLPVREKLHILYWLCMWKMDYTPEIVCIEYCRMMLLCVRHLMISLHMLRDNLMLHCILNADITLSCSSFLGVVRCDIIPALCSVTARCEYP